MSKGKFIVLEGGDGTGKDTNVACLMKAFPSGVLNFTREPGGTRIGNELRNLLLNAKSFDMCPKTELLLFYANRAQHIKEVIAPTLEGGRNVISTRFSLSTLAYQVYGRQQMKELNLCNMLDKDIVGEYVPDLTIFLDLDPFHVMERIHGRKDENNRFDEEDVAFHERVRGGYLKHLESIPHCVVNTDRPSAEVTADVVNIVKEFLDQAA
jgi:dTMP kinase